MLVTVYIFGFLLCFVNFFCCLLYICGIVPLIFNRYRTKRISPKPRHPKFITIPCGYFHILVMIPFAIFLVLGPFVSGLVATPIVKKVLITAFFLTRLTFYLLQQTLKHACDAYPIEVVLKGHSFYDQRYIPSIASFYFRQNNILTKYYEYKLERYNDTWFSFNLRRTEPGVSIPTGNYPLVWRIQYNATTMSADCATSPDTPLNGTQPCMKGTYDAKDFLLLQVTDLRTSATKSFRTLENGWKKKTDEPRFILQDLKTDNSLSGETVMKTTLAPVGDCTSMKLCLARMPDLDILSAVGIALARQDMHSYACTSPIQSVSSIFKRCYVLDLYRTVLSAPTYYYFTDNLNLRNFLHENFYG